MHSKVRVHATITALCVHSKVSEQLIVYILNEYVLLYYDTYSKWWLSWNNAIINQSINQSINHAIMNTHTHTYTCTMHIQPLQDRYLALGVLVLVLVDVIILLVYTIVEGVQGNLTATRVDNRENLMNVEGVGWYMHDLCQGVGWCMWL